MLNLKSCIKKRGFEAVLKANNTIKKKIPPNSPNIYQQLIFNLKMCFKVEFDVF